MNNLKNLALWIIIAVLLVVLFNVFQNTGTKPANPPITYSKFLEQVQKNEIRSVTFQGDKATGEYANRQPFTTIVPSNDTTLWPTLKQHHVDTKVMPPEEGMSMPLTLLVNALPFLLMIGVWIFFMRQMQSGGGKAMGFGKSRAKLLTERSGRVTF
ncbi:MAG TPA: ATP-dependent metallopeptidase FtsH/Yme1/Tma family protein, partial [Rhizomicrobium sp.]|nr:ATP-dependent metallopeptidase FtsH/Yme1/Tma family protein [Rhizomicrobium sp.]